MVKDERQRIGEHTDHGEDNEGGAWMNGGMFEMAVDREGLEYLSVDPPATAAKARDEERRYGTEIEISGVEVGALLRDRDLAFDEMAIFFPDSDMVPDRTADRLDNRPSPD